MSSNVLHDLMAPEARPLMAPEDIFRQAPAPLRVAKRGGKERTERTALPLRPAIRAGAQAALQRGLVHRTGKKTVTMKTTLWVYNDRDSQF
jgi:hypothetical protein